MKVSNRIIEAALEELRIALVLPFIIESDVAKDLGWSVVKTEGEGVQQYRLVESIPAVCDHVFPYSLHSDGRELLDSMDAVYQIMLNDESYLGRYKELRADKAILGPAPRDIDLHVLYANWRTGCTRYLYSLAKSASEATELFVKDQTGSYHLYGAIMALSMVLRGGISEDVKVPMAVLMMASTAS